MIDPMSWEVAVAERAEKLARREHAERLGLTTRSTGTDRGRSLLRFWRGKRTSQRPGRAPASGSVRTSDA